ncbi:hypothetical protein G9A89_020794 [Geosiphon pyriformis]|nr:hypothetical protein G9A89_020794 [Geosiphon pyriformis]
MIGKTSLLTNLLLKIFGLFEGVEATLGLIQVCLFERTLTGEKPAKDEEVASTAFSGSLSSLKAPLNASSSPVGGFFSQKKRVSLRNVKHSGVKSGVSLANPYSDGGMYSDMESDSSSSIVNKVLVNSSDKSFLGSAATTSKAKRVKNNLACGASLGSLDYDIDDDDSGFLPLPLGISLEKKWLNSKIIKTQVEVAVKKSFALDISLLAVEGKLAMAKTQVIRKFIEKATSLARENNIIVNSDLKRQGIHSDWAVVIKEIPMDTPKKMIIATVFEFEEIKSIKIQLIGLWQKAVVEFAKLEQAVSLAARWSFLIGKDSVCVAITVGDCETWASRDWFRALLFTLPVETTAHDLENLLERAGGKTCVINWSLETGNRVRCAVVCFDSDEVLESAFRTEPIFGGVKLSWARLDLVHCKQYEKFSYSALKCDAEVASALKSSKFFIRLVNLNTRLQLAKLYAKKNILISRPVVFGGKFWAQVVSVASVSHGFCAGSGSSSSPFSALSSGGALPPLSVVNSPLNAHLALLKRSVELLSDQISNILFRLDNIGSAPLVPSSQMVPSVVVSQFPISVPLVVANSDLDFNMAVDDLFVQPTSFSPGVTNLLLGLSSSKVLTSKVGGLELKLVAFDIFIGSILAKLDQLCAGSSSSVISLLQ